MLGTVPPTEKNIKVHINTVFCALLLSFHRQHAFCSAFGMVDKSPVTSTSIDPQRVFEEPEDSNIPDNYVSWTLKNQKALPPIRLDNFLQELNWLNVSILTIPPLLAIYGVFNVRLRWETVLFAVFYYFFTGLGMFVVSFVICVFFDQCSRHYCWVPSSLGSQVLQRLQASTVHFGNCWSWSCRGFYQVVVPWSSRPPPIYRHRLGSLQCPQRFLVLASRMDAYQASSQTRCCRRQRPQQK